jgi:uncharacterized protein YaaQ
MKMIMAIVEGQYSDSTASALVNANFRVTRLASTERFLREGATTLMVGVENEQLENALDIIRAQIPLLEDPEKFRATIYVLNVKDFRRV